MAAPVSQKEYLKRYLSGGDDDKKKKKKKKKDKSATSSKGMKIIEDNLSLDTVPYGYTEEDDNPTIAEVTYEDDKIKHMEEFERNKKWKKIIADQERERDDTSSPLRQRHDSLSPPPKGSNPEAGRQHDSRESPPRRKRHDSDDSSPRRRHDSDESPPRRKRHDSDASPPRSGDPDTFPPQRKRYVSDASPPRRKRHDSDTSPKRKRHDSDTSPRRKRHDSDTSPPRRKRHDSDLSPQRADSDTSPPRKRPNVPASSPPRRKRNDSDSSPPRRKRNDSDSSPPRQKRNDSDSSPPRRKRNDSDSSPPRRKRNDSDSSPPRRKRNDSDASPQRRKRNDSDSSPPRRKRNDSDSSPPRRKRNDSDSSPPRRKGNDSDVSTLRRKGEFQSSPPPPGASKEDRPERKMTTQEYLKARKFGKLKKDTPEDLARKEREAVLQKKAEAQHQQWKHGVKQMQAYQQKLIDDHREMGKAFARMADDVDMNTRLKQVSREEDPMLEYMMNKQVKESKQPLKPLYKGPFPPNRFNIRPGYRWDGVDRSSGFENQWFERQNNKRAVEEDAYKWSVSDM
ncbi:BUD13 homolog [Penaeus japonicus]|uniref:BUD13 homolog n=1 Tax=Penaeus japonicus TaxID=27405 RepID=UPI001C71462E|nr:BUD13 homolog [Penaeus japonicus]XP_042868922.1 BUD13 homolog [Penaeus japonicus]